jgi:PglZ domain-containing protein
MTRTLPLSTATLPVVRAMLDQAVDKNYRDGVLGVRAQPRWDGPAEFTHRGVPVRVAACESALAVREALQSRGAGHWLVVITDRDHDDLGDGILATFVGNRARQPDEWEALRQRFQSTGLDPALFEGPSPRQVAAALLTVEPDRGWPPAPGGVLTRLHAMSSVARARLGLDGGEIDGTAVLAWTRHRDAPGRISELRTLGGDLLADGVLAWLADQVGLASGLVLALLRSGRVGDIVPFGLVVGLLTRSDLDVDEARIAREALIRLEPMLGADAGRVDALRAWAEETTRFFASGPADRDVIATSSDELLAAIRAEPLAEHSDLLPSGYAARLARFADAVRLAARRGGDRIGVDSDEPVIDTRDVVAATSCWQVMQRHELAARSPQRKALLAAMRLLRWLATPSGAEPNIAGLIGRHRNHDAWVDSAVNDAATGVSDPTHGAALESLLDIVFQLRAAHDASFARSLATLTRDDPTDPGVEYLEDVLVRHVFPLARQHKDGALLLVLDGMTAAAMTEIADDALAHGWIETVPTSGAHRIAAIAALPTLTEVSRTSLLCGQLCRGNQQDEARGFTALAQTHHVANAVLYHKKPLDSSRPGLLVADDVGQAIDDVSERPLVACVLNTIDDALDRSDPGGLDWTLDTIKHLRPILERARAAGRIVVITSDHGHIVERRQGTQRHHPDISSARSRADDGTLESGEVPVEGRRVLRHGGRAVLAVDERLRYGPLKAGYHGGASPAEVVVPVSFLMPAGVETALLRDAPPAAPDWWDGLSSGPAAQTSAANQAAAPQEQLFELVAPDEPPVTHRPSSDVANAVLTSGVYAAQARLAGRARPGDAQVRALLSALVAAPGTRLPEPTVAATLGIGQPSTRGAIATLQRLLNVEGYPVLDIDVDGSTVVLDVALLREQFRVTQ